MDFCLFVLIIFHRFRFHQLSIVETRSISIVTKPFVFDVFVVKSAQAVTLSIIVLMCVTINDRNALKGTDVGLKLHDNYF